jgi:hypothetical protein
VIEEVEAPVDWSSARVVMSRVKHDGLAGRASGVVRARARREEHGPETCRGAYSSRKLSERRPSMKVTAMPRKLKLGGFGCNPRMSAGVSATKRAFAPLPPRRGRRNGWRGPLKRCMGWSSSPSSPTISRRRPQPWLFSWAQSGYRAVNVRAAFGSRQGAAFGPHAGSALDDTAPAGVLRPVPFPMTRMEA